MDDVRFPMEPPDEAWQAANPGWQEVPPDDPRWRADRKDKSGNLRPPPVVDQNDRTGTADANKEAAPRFTIINPADLLHVPVEPREWIVEDWLPIGCVTADYGDGGTGKTLLAQQLMTSTALLDAPWCGRDVMPCRSFAYFCEDDEDELHRRQAAICEAYGASIGDLASMRWVSGVGQDNSLVTFDFDGKARPTPLYEAIRDAAAAHRARLVVLDTAADMFPGNENDRHQVRVFIGLLNRLAIDLRAAVLLNAHPSRSGLSSGNLDGGSTGWSNSVRSRWSLARPAADGDAEPDNDARILTRRKANYASIGEEIRLTWRNGVLVPQHISTGSAPERAAAAELFLTLLDRCWEQGQFVSASVNAPTYAPKIFSKRSDRSGYTKKEFEAAMSALFVSKRIRVAEFGRPGHWRNRIERQDAGGEGE